MSFTASGEHELSIDINAEDNASGAFDSVTGSSKDMNKAVGAAGAVLAGAGAGAFIKSADAAVSFEDAMMDVQKVTSEQTADELAGELQDLATDVRLSQEELAGLATQAGRMGAEGTDEIANFTETAAKMGASTTLAADNAGKALGKVATALDEPLDNADELADGINELSNNFQTDSAEIVDSAQRSGQALSTLGLESEEVLGLSAAFNETSSSSRVAAQRMQQVGESMMNPDNVEMFADILGVTADEFAEMREESPEETMLELMDAVDGNQGALNTLNDELTKSQANAFRDTAGSADEMREAMELSNEAMDEGGSVADENAQDMSTMGGQMDSLRSELQNIAITMGDAFLPILLDLAEVVGPMISSFADFNEEFDGMPAVIIAGTAALGGLLLVVGALAGPIMGAVAAIGALGTALTVAGGAVAALSLPVLALVGVLIGAIAVWHFFGDEIKEIASSIFETVRDAFGQLKAYLRQTMESISETLRGAWETVKELKPALLFLMGPIGLLIKTWEMFGDDIMAMTSDMNLSVTETFTELSEFITETFVAVFDFYVGIWTDIYDETVAFLTDVFDFYKSTLTDIAEFWSETFDTAFDFLTGWIANTEEAFNGFFEFVTDLFDSIYEYLIGNSVIPKTFNEISEFISGFIADTKELFADFYKAFKDNLEGWIDDSMEMLTAFFTDFMDDTTALLSGLLSEWTSWMDDVTEYVTDALSSVTRWISSTGASLFGSAFGSVADSVTSRVTSMASSISSTITGVADNIASTISEATSNARSSFNSAIPSRLNIPSRRIGGQRVNIPSVTVGDRTVGGGSLSVPSQRVGGGSFDLPQLADGGIITGNTLAQIGEAGDNEAVVPLPKLSQYLDTAYEVGANTAPTSTPGGTNADGSAQTITLRVEGDDKLAEIIRENAELVVEENESAKSDRIARL